MAGEILKQRREELGRDVREIADLLKIKADYLIAIESDSFEKLPAPVYTMGYIRCYAAYLEVDADAIVEFYTSHLAQPATTTIIPVGYSHKKAPRLLYVIVILAVVGAAAYLLLPLFNRMSIQMEPVAPQQAVAPGPTAEVPAPSAALPSPAAGQHQLTVAAVARVWLMARFRDGHAEEMLMKPGETKVWVFSEQVVMKVGNAGGIRLTLDGRDLGTPGSVGEVKTITLPAQQ